MRAMTDRDLSVLDLLEFEPSLPCEMSLHPIDHQPGGPGVWLVVFRCPECSETSQRIVCDVGVRRGPTTRVRHRTCGIFTWDDAVVSCVSLPDGGQL